MAQYKNPTSAGTKKKCTALSKVKGKKSIPVALVLLAEKGKRKTYKKRDKNCSIKDHLDFCIMKVQKPDKIIKKKDNLKLSNQKISKTKTKKQKEEKPILKITNKQLKDIKDNKISKKQKKDLSGKISKKMEKPPKTKKVTEPSKKQTAKKKINENALTVNSIIALSDKKPVPKKLSQTKKDSKNINGDVTKTQNVNKKMTKANNFKVKKDVIVKTLNKSFKKKPDSNMSASDPKPKVLLPKKKVNNLPKNVNSDKSEQSSGESGVEYLEPKTKKESKLTKKKIPKVNKKTMEKALLPVVKGRKSKKSLLDVEDFPGSAMFLSNGKKIIHRKKKVLVKRPKKQREASLNALAKVHCMYENDIVSNCIKTINSVNSATEFILSRSQRSSAQGLRSVGHYWEMLDSSSGSNFSSDDSNDHEMMKNIVEEKLAKIEVVPPIQSSEVPSTSNEEEAKPKKRRKRATEIKMDLKDMVVRKRMASLNASAILAASYSSEKRSTVIVKTQEKLVKQKDNKKNQKCKQKEETCTELVLGKRASKKKKLSVIVEHQDTDVTITVNRSTRSTHHERVCSINGMHYCISSTTSHTQTEATTVATETVLNADHKQNTPCPQLTDSTVPCSTYTPLNALTSMNPPGVNSPSIHRPLVNSAFSAPSVPTPENQKQHNVYQPAGPLISSQQFLASSSKVQSTEQRASNPVYQQSSHLPPPPPLQPQTTIYAPSYAPPYNPLHSNLQSPYQTQYPHQSYYQPQSQPHPSPLSYPRYYPNPKDHMAIQHPPAPSSYYPNYFTPSHGYYHNPPPPSLYLYPSPTYSNSSPSACYSHPQPTNPRLGLLDTGYQNCPCPMQSCPKNVLTGPLTINDKGFIKSQNQTPLPPVMVALPLELSGTLGPPSPARGSTGMPPPPSPALVTAKNPDNGLLTTSKLISESIQVTNDDKMKLNNLKPDIFELNKEVPEIMKNNRKRKQPSIIDKISLKKQAIPSAFVLQSEVKSSPGSDVENQLPVSQSSITPRSTHHSNSQLLLKPINGKLNGGIHLFSNSISNSMKKNSQEHCAKYIDISKQSIQLNLTKVEVNSKCNKTKKIKQDKCSENTTDSSYLNISNSKSLCILENKQFVPISKKIPAIDKGETKSKNKRNSSPFKQQLVKSKTMKLSPNENNNLIPLDRTVIHLYSNKNANLKWSNGWSWEGVPYQAAVYLSNDEQPVIRKCYSAMRHIEGDVVQPKDCILLKSGPRKKDLPFIAKVSALWENPDDGEMMVSLLWYYRPEHTEQGFSFQENKDEIFASRHRDINSVACIEDKCYVLTFNEYSRYRKRLRSIENNVYRFKVVVPPLEYIQYERRERQPPDHVSPDRVFYCHKVYDFRTKRLLKNPC